MKKLFGRFLFFFLAPAFEEYRRRYATLVIREDGSFIYSGSLKKER